MERNGAVSVLLCLALALVAAPVVRSVAMEVSRLAGGVWPFALAHCRAISTPGCEAVEPGRQAALHVR